MSTTHNRTRVIASAVTAVAVPTLLFLGAGTAQAQQNESVSYDGDLFGIGLTVHVTDNSGNSAQCNYTATPEPGQLTTHLLRPYTHQFFLQANDTVSWPISSPELGLPAVATGTKWFVTVDCKVLGGGIQFERRSEHHSKCRRGARR
jgi:hypothetical protein